MKNEHDETKKWIFGLVIGGIVGAGALYCIHAVQNRKTPIIKKIGKTISNVGEMLENCDINSSADAIESIESKIPNGSDILNSVADWVDSGMSLWKKFKKG